MTVSRALVSSLFVAGLGGVLLAQAPALDVKLGLWENTIVTSMSGVPPVDTSKMPPEQAAKIAEAMKAMGNQTITEKTCIKKEDLAKDSFMLPEGSGMTCTRAMVTNTKAAYVADVTCTGPQQMKGHVAIESQGGGTAFTGSMKVATSAQGRTMDLSMKMSGKYLGADCGTVK